MFPQHRAGVSERSKWWLMPSTPLIQCYAAIVTNITSNHVPATQQWSHQHLSKYLETDEPGNIHPNSLFCIREVNKASNDQMSSILMMCCSWCEPVSYHQNNALLLIISHSKVSLVYKYIWCWHMVHPLVITCFIEDNRVNKEMILHFNSACLLLQMLFKF